MTQNDSGFRTYQVGVGGVTRFRRVKLSSGTIVHAGAGEDAIGIAQKTGSQGAFVTVKLFSAPGTFTVEAAGAIASGADVYGAASGKVDDTAAGRPLGTALAAVSADGDTVEIMPPIPYRPAEQTHIADPSGGATVDAEARTAINSILDALEANGILAAS
ncbi:MAG: DUF2190 family protein [Kiritimatiellaeota bacterium]|nr:DUF2190 family protein [Kiritimatiellota bacterium]